MALHDFLKALASGTRRWGWVSVVAGCVSVPDGERAAFALPVPGGWAEHAAAKPVADADWVDSFRDAALNGLVAVALEENRDLGKLAARIQTAEAEAAIAGAAGRPQVSGSFNPGRNQTNFIGLPGTNLFERVTGQEGAVLSSLFNQFELTLNLRWELDIWGRVRAGRSASLERLEASRGDYEAARLSLAGQVVRTWFEMAAAADQIRLAEEALRVFLETERVVESDFREGVVRPGRDAGSDLSLARVDVANARAALAGRETDLPRMRRRLEVLLGRYPQGAVEGAGRLPDLPGLPAAGIPAQLLERRPDLLAAERRLAAADHRVLEAERSLLPAISLTSAYGTTSPELSGILNGDRVIWNLAGNLTQPLLEGGRLRETVKARGADRDFAMAEYEQAVLNAFQEVEDALSREKFLAEQQRAAEEAVRLAGEAMKRTQSAFKDGLGDVLSLLNAQQRWINAKSSLIDVRRQRLENRVDLHLALGGSFAGGRGSEESRLPKPQGM